MRLPESFDDYRGSLDEGTTLRLVPHGEDDNGNPVYKQRDSKQLFVKVDGRLYTCADDNYEADEVVKDKYEVVEEARKPAKDTPEWHEHKIAVDTVRNPSKALLGGPSAEEAETKLREKFGYSEKEVEALKESVDLNDLLRVPRSGADGYVFSGSWATVLMSSLKEIGINVDSYTKDPSTRTDTLIISNSRGETQAIKLQQNVSMNVVKFKRLIKIKSGAALGVVEEGGKLSWGCSEEDYREMYRLGKMTKPSDKKGETLKDYEALVDRMFGNDHPGRGWRDGMPPDVYDAMRRAKTADEFIKMLAKPVHEASGKPLTRKDIAKEMGEHFKGITYGFDNEGALVVEQTGKVPPSRNDLANAAKEICEHFASMGYKVAFNRQDLSVVFHDLEDGLDEASVFWGKEQLKWFTVLDNKVGNLATTLLWLRGWYPSEDRFKGDRERINRAIEGMKDAATEIDDMVEEIGDYLKATLADMNTYKARI